MTATSNTASHMWRIGNDRKYGSTDPEAGAESVADRSINGSCCSMFIASMNGLFYATRAADGCDTTLLESMRVHKHIQQEERANSDEDDQGHLDSGLFIDLGDEVRCRNVDRHSSRQG